MNAEDIRASIYFLEQKNKEMLIEMDRLVASIITKNEDYETLMAERLESGGKEIRVTELKPADAKKILNKVEILERRIRQNGAEVMRLIESLPPVDKFDYMKLRDTVIENILSDKLKIIPSNTKEYAISKKSPNLIISDEIVTGADNIVFDDLPLRQRVHALNDDGMTGVISLTVDYSSWTESEDDLIGAIADVIRSLGDNLCAICAVSALALEDIPYPENINWDLNFNFIKDKFKFPIISNIENDNFDALIYDLTYDIGLDDEGNAEAWYNELSEVEGNLILRVGAEHADLINKFVYADNKYSGWILD